VAHQIAVILDLDEYNPVWEATRMGEQAPAGGFLGDPDTLLGPEQTDAGEIPHRPYRLIAADPGHPVEEEPAAVTVFVATLRDQNANCGAALDKCN
jgi:hypothetical protein